MPVSPTMVMIEPIEKSHFVSILIVIMFVEKGKMKSCDIIFIMKYTLMRVSKWCNCSVDGGLES